MKQQSLESLISREVKRLSDGDSIAARVSEGVVTLTGTVGNEMRRKAIEQTLLGIPEVLDVHNYLRVAIPAGDARTQLRALLEGEDVDATGLRIDHAAGRLVLEGAMQSWFDRDLAERLAWTLPDVTMVENRITIPRHSVDPNAEEGDSPSS